MQHEFILYGSNAMFRSHVCDNCGLVVTTSKASEPPALPHDGCLVRNAVLASREPREECE
jgi:hypothetical protein